MYPPFLSLKLLYFLGILLRVIDSLQLTVNHSLATPANWNHGDDVIIAPSVSDEEAAERFPDHVKVKPYLRVTGQPNL